MKTFEMPWGVLTYKNEMLAAQFASKKNAREFSERILPGSHVVDLREEEFGVSA